MLDSVKVPDEVLRKYKEDRAKLITEIASPVFDKGISLTSEEERAAAKLEKLRQ